MSDRPSAQLAPHLSQWHDSIFQNAKREGELVESSLQEAEKGRTKTEIFQEILDLLGTKMLEGGIEIDNSKIKVIQEWPVPKMATDVRCFLGFTNYYCRFIYKYAQVTQPL